MLKFKPWPMVTTVLIMLNVSVFYVYIILYDIVSSSHPRNNTDSCKTNNISKTSFAAQIKNFKWKEYSAAFVSNEEGKIRYYCRILLRKLIPFLTKSPAVPINTTCLSPPLSLPPRLKCKALEKPRRIGVLLQLGFDIDALEIHLNELDGIVDKFFILESIQSHNTYVKQKPLLWDMVKGQERFSTFLEKIVHFVVDDSYLSQIKDGKKRWRKELLQERLRWQKFLQWNAETNYFTNSDILGFGDTDEVPNRDNIFFLKTCQVDVNPIDIGIWFPFNGILDVFQSDYPVKDHPFTLGDPTYWTLETAKKLSNNSGYLVNGNDMLVFPTRMRGKSPKYLLGGMHLSRYSYPPLRFAKLLTATEADMTNIQLIIEAGEHYVNDRLEEADSKLNYVVPGLKDKIVNLEHFRKINESEANAIIKLPWFYNCNRKRYPAFEGRYDMRLD